ncbi:hypothetical protein N7535_000210 [Penicillium sp. DV-2018c]|nr:hypothetical protein N7535_000210 [Penicillium sp. DV-2018c]
MGSPVRDSCFVIGPDTDRDWFDAGRSILDVERGPLDSRNPEKIKGLIHGQPCHISPLFNHNLDPAFLGWDGLGPQTLDLGPKPNLKGLSPDELFAAVHEDAL